MKSAFLIVQALKAIQPDPTTGMLTLRLRVLKDCSLMASTLLQLLGTELNRNDSKKARKTPRSQKARMRSGAAGVILRSCA